MPVVSLPAPTPQEVYAAIPWPAGAGLVWQAQSAQGVQSAAAYPSAPRKNVKVGYGVVTYLYFAPTFANLATVVAYVDGKVYLYSARKQVVVAGFGLPQLSPDRVIVQTPPFVYGGNIGLIPNGSMYVSLGSILAPPLGGSISSLMSSKAGSFPVPVVSVLTVSGYDSSGISFTTEVYLTTKAATVNPPTPSPSSTNSGVSG